MEDFGETPRERYARILREASTMLNEYEWALHLNVINYEHTERDAPYLNFSGWPLPPLGYGPGVEHVFLLRETVAAGPEGKALGGIRDSTPRMMLLWREEDRLSLPSYSYVSNGFRTWQLSELPEPLEKLLIMLPEFILEAAERYCWESFESAADVDAIFSDLVEDLEEDD